MITNSSIGYFGRMGNQLFQVAFLFGQCLRLGRRAIINRDVPGFDLYHFRLSEEGPVTLLPRSAYSSVSAREIFASWPERSFVYAPEMAWGADGCDYTGYFQSPLYFEDCAPVLRRALRIGESPTTAVTHWEHLIERSTRPVVGIHVRLGDYLLQPGHHTNLQKTDYYERAIHSLGSMLQTPFTPLVFSDDIGWCQTSGLFADLDKVHFVSGNAGHWDLHLLSLCAHHVIANSSFSWWGAWLAFHRKQIVVAPQQWFGPTGVREWSTIYPASWHRLDSSATTPTRPA